MIEDWETGQLYWNCLSRHEGDEAKAKAIADVRKKYFEDFVLNDKELVQNSVISSLKNGRWDPDR